ncbi:hypothetical protein PM082_022574 [Marasmius tenuissimus]|nr:hypothetical protein PM082_022574 [Marasmius tenuissimus]
MLSLSSVSCFVFKDVRDLRSSCIMYHTYNFFVSSLPFTPHIFEGLHVHAHVHVRSILSLLFSLSRFAIMIPTIIDIFNQSTQAVFLPPPLPVSFAIAFAVYLEI